jgi:glycine/D-amino acid oxidase-like deaminating enzyme
MHKSKLIENAHNKSFGRRDFLRGAFAAGAVTTLGIVAGCSPATSPNPEAPTASPSTAGNDLFPGPEFTQVEPFEGEIAFIAEPIAASEIIATEDYDVLVIGAGISGASALASAAEAGAKTLLVEKGTTFAAHGVAAASIGCKVQTDAGIVIDRNTIVGDAMQSGNYRVNADVIMLWADNSAEAIDWIVDTIVTPAGIVAFPPWTQTYEESWCKWYPTHINLGKDMFEGMSLVVPATLDYAVSKGAEIRYETPAVQLVRDSASRRVTGAIVRTPDGYAQINTSKGVILATGGYENNYARMRRYFRPRDLAVNSFYMTAGQNTGDGHEMGLAIGAAEDEAPHTFLIAGAMTPWLSINQLGERFMNNRLPYDYAAQQIAMQPGAKAWQVFDSNYQAAVTQWGAESNWLRDESGGPEAVLAQMATLEDQVASGQVFRGETIEALAGQIGVPANTLKATIDRWNQLCAVGVDDDYGTAHAYLTPVAQGPFYAQNSGCGGMTTVSGLKINKNLNVTDFDGNPIEGLYAVGNVSGGMFDGTYTHHINGLSHGRCITFGYLAGRRAAGAIA